MLSIEVDEADKAIPEVSANKYFTYIRFLAVSDERLRGSQLDQDIRFKMIMSSFDPVVE